MSKPFPITTYKYKWIARLHIFWLWLSSIGKPNTKVDMKHGRVRIGENTYQLAKFG